MQINTAEIKYLVGDNNILANIASVPALPMFSDSAMGFLAALSSELLHDKRSKQNIDVLSYAYWIRKASLEQAKQGHSNIEQRMGRGVAFHIAPSNVPINFVVSMTSALLAGNASIIRVSNKDFVQVEIICDAINGLLSGEYANMKPYFCIIRYEHNDEITRELSAMCDVRIIWGGDNTIRTIQKAPIPTRAIELAFADRYSISIIDSDTYMKSDYDEVTKGFYTDTYYSDQNACSSPRMIIWMGSQIEEAKVIFWDRLKLLVDKDYEMKPIQSIDKLNSFCAAAMSGQKIKKSNQNNTMVRVQVERLSEDLFDYKNGGGYFFEYHAGSLAEILPILQKKCQTVSYLGGLKEDIQRLVFDNGVKGVDRIVPIGTTMDLSFVWDGYDMVETMSRRLSMI